MPHCSINGLVIRSIAPSGSLRGLGPVRILSLSSMDHCFNNKLQKQCVGLKMPELHIHNIPEYWNKKVFVNQRNCDEYCPITCRISRKIGLDNYLLTFMSLRGLRSQQTFRTISQWFQLFATWQLPWNCLHDSSWKNLLQLKTKGLCWQCCWLCTHAVACTVDYSLWSSTVDKRQEHSGWHCLAGSLWRCCDGPARRQAASWY